MVKMGSTLPSRRVLRNTILDKITNAARFNPAAVKSFGFMAATG